MKTRNILAAIAFGMFTFASQAQLEEPPAELAVHSRTYHTGIGLRAGETSGLTFKQFIGQRHALEAILGVWNRGFSGTLLYEHHTNAFNASGLNWYYGAGGHFSFHESRYVFYRIDNRRYEYYTNGAVGIGVDGIFGLEYKIPNAPIAASLDLKPYVEVITSGNVWMSIDPGLGIKVVF